MVDPGTGRLERVRDLCRKLKPILGPPVERLFLAYSAEDKAGKEQIEAYLEVLAAKYLAQRLDAPRIDLVPPPAEKTVGPYVLGTVQYGGKEVSTFGLREGEWIQHVGVFGRSGAGKSNLGFEIFRQLLLQGKPVLVFDWKRNYRDLLILPEFRDVEVYTVGRDVAPFQFNPLIPPPDTDPKTWLKQIIEVVAHSYALGNGVLYLLQESVDAVYREFGVYDGRVTAWPTFRDVLITARERNAKGRESAWLSSTLRALASMCFGHMDQLLNTADRQSDTLDRLLTRSVILEMDALGQADKVFLISALLLFIHHRRMAEGERETFKHAIVVEEAHHVLSNERHSLIGGQSVMEITFREIREFGEDLVILDQAPSQISMSALGNTYCTICLNLKHQKDVSAMAQSMLLETHEKDILGSLEVGEAVVKLQGRAPQPFLIRIPEFAVRKGTITDKAVELRMAPVLAATRTLPARPPEAIERPPATGPVPATPSRPESGPAEAFLLDVHDYPESGVAARYKRLGLSVRQGQKLKERLVREGLLEDREEHTPTGRIRLLRLTEQGAKGLKKAS